MDNLEVFHKNGFEFEIDADAEPTARVSMKTQPVSKNWTFGKDGMRCNNFYLVIVCSCHCGRNE